MPVRKVTDEVTLKLIATTKISRLSTVRATVTGDTMCVRVTAESWVREEEWRLVRGRWVLDYVLVME